MPKVLLIDDDIHLPHPPFLREIVQELNQLLTSHNLPALIGVSKMEDGETLIKKRNNDISYVIIDSTLVDLERIKEFDADPESTVEELKHNVKKILTYNNELKIVILTNMDKNRFGFIKTLHPQVLGIVSKWENTPVEISKLIINIFKIDENI